MSSLSTGDGDLTGFGVVRVALTTAQTLELRRTGRTEFVVEDGTTVVVGHEDALDSLDVEVGD